jgi:hypothetical protein
MQPSIPAAVKTRRGDAGTETGSESESEAESESATGSESELGRVGLRIDQSQRTKDVSYGWLMAAE